MIPQPLHPAVVHFPIVFVVLLPIIAIVAIVLIRRGVPAQSAWLPVVGIAAALAATSWVAVRTGELEEDAVERVVAESAIHDHEENAELFFPLTLAGLLVVSAGLLRGRPGRVFRSVAVAAALGLTFAGYQVGHSGGALVYEHGAATAYSGAVRSSLDSSGGRESREREHESERLP